MFPENPGGMTLEKLRFHYLLLEDDFLTKYFDFNNLIKYLDATYTY